MHINTLAQADFTTLLGPLFEHSPWVASRTWTKRPFPDAQTLLDAMLATLAAASPAEQLALIRAHPDLAGQALIDDNLTAASAAEQAAAGLTRLSPADHAQFQALNATYREKFGFPFIICVRRQSRASILAQFIQRLDHTQAAEHAQALAEIGHIARLRLAGMATKEWFS